MEGGKEKVVLEGPNGEEEDLEELESKTYRESDITGPMTLKDKLKIGQMGLTIANIVTDIMQFIEH